MVNYFKNSVFWVSSVIVLGFVIWGAVSPDSLSKHASSVYGFTANAFGWFYLVTVLIIILFCLTLAFSKWGKLKLGRDDDVPEYSLFTWIAMLFSCGFGISIVFWGVAEPMTHFIKTPPVDVNAGTPEAARVAMQYTFFDEGIHQWAAFTIVGLAIAYFHFRKKRRSMVSETLNPVLRGRSQTSVKKVIDILAIIATVVGVATSLGMGILQINGGLNEVLDVPKTIWTELAIVGIMLILYMLSALTGLNRGIRYLSNINLSLALILMIVVLFLGPTVFDLKIFVTALGDYIQNFFQMSLHLQPYEGGSWVKKWPVFYWAWTIAWSPFVGMFVARISKGRTIREFILGVLLAPPFIGLIWISIFGGAALHMDLFQGTSIADAVQGDITSALFVTLQNFPLSTLLSILVILLIFTFLITSADSATFVLGIMTSEGNMNPPVILKVIWGVLISAIAAVLIVSSGLEGLQTASLISALPFAVIIFGIIASLIKSLRKESVGQVTDRRAHIYKENQTEAK
ncbi:BCCT family transporter [Tuberibacillus sp. Marseille-P3662]|uniref:BCCT family transporter n=1 Tax=Tuberibacillus sp. Marseille-P3662 TaxID=1965358 RepID=UPI000A1C80AE|nr:BCCT family transporter [Tuberibacillus sp. Marseille-P3662]